MLALNGQANPVLYIDGILRPVKYAEGAARISLYRSSANLHIGAQVGANNYYGANCIDEVRIYNRALSADEIKKLVDMTTQPDMVAYYPFNGNAKDESGNNNDGIVVGDPPLVQDNFKHAKGAYAFGPNRYIKVLDKPELRIAYVVSIAAWVKRTNLGIDMILEKGDDWTIGNSNYGLGLHNINNNMFYFFFKGGWRGVDAYSERGVWHHYAVVAVNGETNPVFYIDGRPRPVKYTGGEAKINLFPSVSGLFIGAQVGTYNYFGSNIIDELRIYNRVLSADEIKKLANPLLQPGN